MTSPPSILFVTCACVPLACSAAQAPSGDIAASAETASPATPLLSDEAQAASPAAVQPPEGTPATRYRVGDYVVYAYSGSLLPKPVTLTEEIVAQDGLRLEILATARRGAEERQWVQVVTDTPENRKSEKLDELYLVKDGNRLPLANENNADAYRLYQWVLPPEGGEMRDKQRSTPTMDVAGRSYATKCMTAKQKVAEREAVFEYCDSEAFLWTQVRISLRAAEGGELLYLMEVTDSGRR